MDELIKHQEQLKQRLDADPVKEAENLFKNLRDADFSIAPWVAPDFWISMRHVKFAESYISEILKELERNTRSLCDRKGAKSDKPKKLKKQEILLTTIVHLVFAYRRSYSESVWREPINSILKYSEPRTSALLDGILPYLENPSVSIENVIIPMLDNYDIDILQLSIPFYSLMMLIRMIYFNKGATGMIAKIFTSLLRGNRSRKTVFIIIHIIKVLLSAFPEITTPEWDALKKTLMEKVSLIEPISSLAAETASAIDKEMQNHGRMYHETLRYILDFSPATDGVVPFLFDQSYRYLGNFLYTHSAGTDNYDLAIIKFVKYYIRSHFKSAANPDIPVFYEIFSRLKFTEKNDAKLVQEFGLTESSKIDLFRAPRPPLVSFQPIKFHVHIDFNENVIEPFSPIENFFKFPTKAVFNQAIMSPLSKYLNENPGCDMIDQKILLSGNDLFISTVLLSLISSSVQRVDIQRLVSFTFFVLPLSLENEGSISQFISKADPVYEKFVHSVYDIVSNIAPVYNEGSKASFTGLSEEIEQFDSHPWFTDPAPQNAFRFAIQHFLMFARSYVDIYVWKISLVINTSDNPTVIVPMIGSLHFGPQLCKEMTDAGRPRTFNIRLTNCHDELEAPISQKLTSIAVWNADEVTGVAPWDDWLLVERTASTSAVNRSSETAPVDRDLVHGMTISEAQNNTFSVMIDQRVYNNILNLSISFMEDLSDPTERMKMKFATFGVVH